ncbi:Gfo/Idh/MocA family protein [Candidatus Latescibacterota bacterium]
MPEYKTRRVFLAGGAAGAASLVSETHSEAAPSPDRKLRIGVVGLGFVSFSWSDIMEGTSPGTRNGNLGTPLLNMDITHVWHYDRKAGEEFAGRMDAKFVDKFDDMIGEIDGVIFSGWDEIAVHHLLAKPFLEAGIPTYIGRPFAYSLRDIDELLETAAAHNTPIMATAKFEHYREIPALRNKIKNVGRIRTVQADTNTVDFPKHFHMQFMMLRILGYDVRQVSMFTDHDLKSNYVHLTYLYPGKDNQPPYVCTIDGARIPDSFHIRIIGDEGIEKASMLRGYENWEQRLQFRYMPQVIDMQRTFYGKNFEPYENVRKKTEIFLTAYYSYLERGGAPVDVGTVPADWRVNSPNIDAKPDMTRYK